MPASLYEVLGVPTDATDAQVRAAYRRSALLHHPDKGGDGAAFARCAEAYAVLSDAPRRAAYDRLGDAALVGLQVDVEAALAEVFEAGGLFEQARLPAAFRRIERRRFTLARARRSWWARTTPSPRWSTRGTPRWRGGLRHSAAAAAAAALTRRRGSRSMQLSFASFMRHAMGGGDGGPVLLPDGSLCSAPRVKMPSLADLMEGVDDPEELAMMELVARKMGVGGRGALVAGTGLQALGVLQRLGEDPGLWSDEEDDDAYLDELQAAPPYAHSSHAYLFRSPWAAPKHLCRSTGRHLCRICAPPSAINDPSTFSSTKALVPQHR
ncbi:hypothetical protein AB1Y20_005485 [Prymnesium parvum]|uniref:J domain-containing protein n=1 Tax=Prymnesium parvum TaxID=97485 RepID=A0AB34J4G6_PRYPA